MKDVRLLICFAFLLAFAANAQENSKNYSLYEMHVIQDREEKDASFSNPEESPLPEDIIPGFDGLDYFPTDEKYRVEAKLRLTGDTSIIEIPTNTDRTPKYRRYAVATFTLEEDTLQLTLYQSVNLMKDPDYHNYLFLPFNDLTNGVETYGGGRYLDLTTKEKDSVIIDFNKAYNPYCAYNAKYSCPIPPDENNLKIQIRAGEKAFD